MPRATLDDRDRELLAAPNFCHVSTLREDGTTPTVLNMEDPYEYLTLTGHVAEETEDGAMDHIDAMAEKYIGQDSYPFHQPGDVRVIFRIAPDHVMRHKAG